jgi:peroxiredoxin Q/BCP
MLEPGAAAPPFRLPDHDGQPVALRDLRGRWVVLYFYPRDDTPGCTVEACEFTAALPALRALDAVVYGCSADGMAAHQRFREKHQLAVGLLTDADREVMTAYGAWGKKVMYGREVEGVIRSTVLIAPDGRIAHHWPNVRAAGHAEQVRARLAELQGTAATASPAPAKGKAAVKAKASGSKTAGKAEGKAKAAAGSPRRRGASR